MTATDRRKPQLEVPERAFQQSVIDLAERLGWLVGHHHDSRRQIRPGVFVGDKRAKGFPDLVCARERVIFIELKRDRSAVTAEQQEWLRRLWAAGAEAYVWRPSNWPEIEETLTTRRSRP